MNRSSAPEPLTVAEVFDQDRYSIPLYQRPYAWTEAEIDTLLEDVRLARQTATDDDYYIGSLVVDTTRDVDGTVHEVVDGQQRLTTLTVLCAVARSVLRESGAVDDAEVDGLPVPHLEFAGRPEAQRDVGALIAHGRPGAPTSHQRLADVIAGLTVAGIKNAAARLQAALSRGLEGHVGEADGVVFERADLHHLLGRVRILRTALPPGTDLNHYFEIMNTRGEQLAKHEVLKAQLMSVLPRAEHDTFARVWDACAVLDRHVQLQFTTQERSRVFGDHWDALVPEDFVELHACLAGDPKAGDVSRATPRTLADVLAGRTAPETEPATTARPEDDDGTYGSIIDFPNFLLHVLKVMSVQDAGLAQAERWGGDVTSVRLEDKDLLEQFAVARRPAEGDPLALAEFSRRFAFRLLKLRLLLDTFVIRTRATLTGTPDEENWVLEQAYRQGDGRGRTPKLSTRAPFGGDRGEGADGVDRVRALQAMFQVTDTRRTSKYFLFRILLWLDAVPPGQESMSAMLESLAAERLAGINLDDVAHHGTRVPNFLFNVLDYILWSAQRYPESAAAGLLDLLVDAERRALATGAASFRFRYRTSVEHFYPVQPSANHVKLPVEIVDQFGNLCVMSRSENSRRNNLMPLPKVGEFGPTGQSLKFHLMAALTVSGAKADPDVGAWTPAQMRNHGNRMLALLERWCDVVGPGHDRAAVEARSQ
ncbi:DUF262 domain-containing protein [Micrococcus luteus]|uniref:DUF262 domain-containing protein n=1 Tax=Micrococcus luteus TaxID=1270 RepID=UPI000BA5C0FE|nr:DUF262 domain-containing protein [Micrococcus luteus]PAL17318.1 hypothetical protein B8X03_04515 [Micrococcus luteus]